MTDPPGKGLRCKFLRRVEVAVTSGLPTPVRVVASTGEPASNTEDTITAAKEQAQSLTATLLRACQVETTDKINTLSRGLALNS